MKEYSEQEALRAIAERNGIFTAQCLLQEECAELIQAVSKKHRQLTWATLEHLLEEMADVSIMLEELAYLIPDGHARIRRWREEKLERTLVRLNLTAEMKDREEST